MRAFVTPAAALLLCAPLATTAVSAQDELAARSLAATCANCHGTDGLAQGREIKPLAGMPAERLLALMADFKSGAEPATVMHQIARGYSDAQLRLIAAYFAARKAPR
jgi:cytochrome c553